MGPTICLSVACSVSNNTNDYHGRIELDSHADKADLGCNCVIITYTGKEWEVSPYRDENKLIQHVPIVTRATAWTFPHSGETFILVFNEALWMGEKLDQNLVNPNHMCYHCIDVQDNNCMHKTMFITCPQGGVTILIYMSGTIMWAYTSSPTQQQLEDCPRIILTSQHDWDPHPIHFRKGSHR